MRSWVEISLGTIRANFRAVRTLAGDAAEIMPVVKADAYRHGAVEVSRALEEEGAPWLAVANVEEGIALRQAGIRARILVMADFLPGEREALTQMDLTPVIHSLEDIAHARGAYHLKIDTGMGRLGTRAAPEERLGTVTSSVIPSHEYPPDSLQKRPFQHDPVAHLRSCGADDVVGRSRCSGRMAGAGPGGCVVCDAFC